MTVATDKKKISAYLDEGLKDSADALAKARGMSLSTLVAYLLSKEVREAKQTGEMEPDPFDLAIDAYAVHCEENNLVFQQPSVVDSEEKNGIIYLRNVNGTLARYSIKQERIL